MIIVNLQLKANPETLAEFMDWFAGILPDTRNYEGCSEVNFCVNHTGEDDIEVISKWDSKESYDAYLHWREDSGLLAELPEWLASEPVFRFLEVQEVY